MKTIYYNGTILTMENLETVQAVLVQDEKIIGIGKLNELQEKAGKNVELYDLRGKTLMPAFIDSHSHITMAAQMSVFAFL